MKTELNFSLLFKELAIALLLLPMGVFAQEANDPPSPKEGARIYEMRIYFPHEGKLEDLLTRFREHTTDLFEKHGFVNVAYWVTRPGESPSYATKMAPFNEGEESLLYIVSFPDMEARNKSWEAFVNDPEWIRVYEESRKNGPLVREIEQLFMDPTDFSNLR